MPITMSNANIDDALSTADAFNQQSVEFSGEGGATANTHRVGFLGLGGTEATGAALAGVTAEFVTAYNTACEAYKSDINAKIDEMQNVSSSSAFQGEGITGALSRFVEGVKAVATSYTASLTAVQIQMANAVAAAYATQDTDLSGQMDADTSTLQSESATVGQ